MMMTRVLLPSDGSDTAMKAAVYAARLMKTNPKMKLTVLVVIPRSNEFLGKNNNNRKEIMEKIDRVIEAKAAEILEKTMNVFKEEGIGVEGLIEKGDPAGVILDYSGKGKYDHIIMGSRGVSELRGVAVGSVSHKVIQLADSRVTLVK